MNSENNKSSTKEKIYNELRDIRKNKGLSIEEVADKLKLSSHIIQKLESDDLTGMGAYPYVRGYLLNYTKLLGVDSEKFIGLIPKSEIEIPLINTSANYSKGIKLRRQSKNLASYALGTFIVLIVSFSGWFLLKNYTGFINNKNNEIVEINNLEILPKQELSLSNNEQDNNEQDTPSNEQTENYHYSSLIPTDAKISTDSNLSTVEENNLIIPEQNSIDQNAIVEETTDVEFVYNVTIEATETSWVKVEHVDNGQKLHNDLLKPGMITVESNKPIHFRIGNEKKVNVSINGESIDLSQFSNKNIADFKWPLGS